MSNEEGKRCRRLTFQKFNPKPSYDPGKNSALSSSQNGKGARHESDMLPRGPCLTAVSDKCKSLNFAGAYRPYRICSLECPTSGLTSLPPDLLQEMEKTYLLRSANPRGMLFLPLLIRSELRMPTDSIRQRSFIDILDDDSLLHIFSLYRPVLLDEDETQNSSVLLGGEWHRERWWYKLVHVCRRWRDLILGFSSGLGLCLVCKHATPIVYMLAHSPPLPLIIDHLDEHHGITPEDEERILLALQHRDRVRRIRLMMPVPSLQKIIIALGKVFSMLEYLYVAARTDELPNLILPETFQAPQLRHLILIDFAFPITSPFLATATGLVTLWLSEIPPSSYFHRALCSTAFPSCPS